MSTLETGADRARQERIMQRLTPVLGGQVVECQQFSACDYMVIVDGIITLGVEVKGRLISEQTARGYGDLMLHYSRVTSLLTLRNVLRIAVRVVWGFDDGRGPLWSLDPVRLTDVWPEPPPARRDQRGASADKELVVMVPWTMLRPVRPPGEQS